MSIYLITNRSTSGASINDTGKERGLSTFRIAEAQIDESKEKLADKVTFNLIDDLDDSALYRHQKGRPAAARDLLTNMQELTGSERLFAELYSQMLASSGRADVLFFIHGFANDVESSRKNIYQLYKRYVESQDSPIEHLVYFSWPTVGHMGLTYWNDQEDAENAGLVVSRLFRLLRGFYVDMFELGEEPHCGHRLHLAAHSMGNQVLGHALDAMNKNNLFQMFEEVLLLNADIEHDVFEQGKPFSFLENLTERIHIYIHRSDDALRISRFTKNFNKRLGHRGPKDPSSLPHNAFIVDSTDTAQDIDAVKFFDELREKAVDHWGYLYRSKVIEDIRLVLAGVDENGMTTRSLDERSNNLYRL